MNFKEPKSTTLTPNQQSLATGRQMRENGMRFSGLTIKSAGTMGENDLLRKLNQCAKKLSTSACF